MSPMPSMGSVGRWGTHRLAATPAGYCGFVAWAHGLGQLVAVGIEGPGHFGAGLARHLRAEGIAVSEVGRPKRQRRARFGKSDDTDAAGAAAMVLAGDALGEPKSADGAAEMVRVLRVARTSVVRARAKAYNALQDLVVTAPAALREQLAGLYKDRLIYACEQLPEPETLTTPTDAVTVAIKSLAARCRELDTEAARLERHVDTITATAAPELRAIYGVGPDTAATLLTTLGDNRAGSAPTPLSPNSAESAHWKHPAAKQSATDSTGEVTATPTVPCTSSWWCACVVISPPATTSPAAWPKAKPRTRSCAASSATSPARSTTPSANPAEEPTNSLPEDRSIWYRGRGSRRSLA
jgi:transposase